MIAQKDGMGNKTFKVHWTDDGEHLACESATQLRIDDGWTVSEMDAGTFYRDMKAAACSACHRAIGYRVAPVKLPANFVPPATRRAL